MSKLITTKHECRAWAKSFIAENTFFGPFPGDFTKLIKRVQDLNTSSIPFEATDGDDSVIEYDILHGDFSWMREVNPACFEEEQNMEAICTSQDQVFFRSTRGILDGEELRVWPTPSLEQQFGIKYRSLEAEFKERQQTCQHCQKSFQYPRALAVHNTFGCEGLGSRTSSNDTLDCNLIDKASNDDLSTTYAGRRSTEMREIEHDDMEIGPKQTSRQQQSLRSTGDTAPKLNPQFSVTLGHSRVLSNSRLARLISSFPRPHFHKFARREPQSLAEYHKQEFRKKFQGNEHYLRRHLYRENMERKGSVKNRRPLAEDEEREMSMEGVDKELHVKQEEEEFINCFPNDYSSGHTSPTDESFMRGRTADEPRCNFQGEDLPLNDSLNISVPENAVTNGYFTVTTHETQHIKRSSRAAQECTCRDRDISNSIPKQRKKFTRYEEINASNETEMEGSKENTSNASTLKQLSAFETQANLTRLGSYHVLHRTQTDHVSFGQHLPCHYCYSTPSMAYAPNKNVIRRCHEPAFLVDPMYRYTAYPRMLSYFAQQSTNSTQVAPRNQGFKCEYCGKVYCRKYVLKIHKRTHTGFKPLRCKVCDKSFSDPSNMKKHVKLHENEDTVHKCRYCGRNFVRYRGLLNHIKSKHSEQIPISNAM